MSETPDPSVPPSPNTDAGKSETRALSPPAQSPAAQSAPVLPRRRRWPRRLRRIAVVLLLLIVAFRFISVMLLPSVLKKVAGIYGMDCTYDRLDLSALSGDAGLWRIAFTPKAGGEPILQSDYCRAKISLFDLLRGRLSVSRLEADGATVLIERNNDGTIPLLKLLNAATSSSSGTAARPTIAPVPTTAPSKPISLSPPLRLDALRLTHVDLHLLDRASLTPLDAHVQLNVRISDFGSTVRPTSLAVDVDADPYLDALHFDGVVHSDGKSVDSTLQASVQGLRLRSLAAYLEPLGIRPIANEISLHASGQLKAGPAAANPNMLTASIDAKDIAAIADGNEAAACDHFSLNADAIDLSTIKLSKITVDGARILGRRAVDGDIRFLGLEILPRSKAATAPPSTAPTPVASAPLKLPIVSLGEFTLHGGRAGFTDEAVNPAVDLLFDAEELSAKNIVFDPAHTDAAVQFTGIFHAPGMMKSAHLDGTFTPFAAKKTAKISVTADGIAPIAIRTYLDAIGIESQLNAARFACDIDADASLSSDGIQANATLQNVKFADMADLIAIDHIRLDGVGYHLNPAKLTLKDIEIAGPVLNVRHDANGSLAALGFRTRPHAVMPAITANTGDANSAAAATQPAATQPAGPLPALSLPAVEIDRFVWQDIHIQYEDLTVKPALNTALTDAGVEVRDVLLDLSPPNKGSSTASGEPGKIHAWAKVPYVADMLSLEGTVTPQPSAVAVDMMLSAKGLTGNIVAPYLKRLGIEPTLRSGTLGAMIHAGIAKTESGINASLSVKHATYTDGDQELAGVDALSIDGVRYGIGGLVVGDMQIDHPRMSVARESDGAFSLAGVQIAPDVLSRISSQSATDTPSAASSGTTARSVTQAGAAAKAPFVLTLTKLGLKDAALSWTDRDIRPIVSTTAHASVDLDHLTIGRASDPARFHVATSVDGSIDRATVNGTIVTNPDSPGATVAVEASGLRAGALAAYLPPGITVSLHDGRFRATMDLGVSKNPAGGFGAKGVVNSLDYRDGDSAEPLLKLDSARAIVARVDLPGFIAVDEISTAGVETSAQRLADGGIGLLGIALHAPPASAAKEPAATTMPSAVATSAPAGPPVDVATLVAREQQTAPAMTLTKLDIHVKRVTLRDLTRPTAAPLTIADLHLRNLSPVDWGGKDAEAHPPTPFRLDSTIDPVIGSLALTAQLAPFAQMPSAQIDLNADGIHGDGLTALVPELKQFLDGSGLTDGQFHVRADAQFKVARHGAYQIDVARGVGADLSIKDIAFRETPNGPVTAGLTEIHSDGVRIRNDGSVHVKTLEITKPIGRVVREKDGIHALGLVIKLPAAPTTAPATPQLKAQVPTAVASANLPPPASVAAHPTSEISVDQLLISDVDFQAEDRTLDPPLTVPITSLDVEVRNFSSLAQYEDKPVLFSALVGSGKVHVPKHISGGASSNGAVASVEAKQAENLKQFEDRELFAQTTATGKIGLYPSPNGWIKTSVSGLELAALGGAAREAGVDLTRGVFDSTVDARLPGDGTVQISSRFQFTDLSLSEPPNGPIFRLLHLPAPLDVVIAALQDADDSITVPLSVPIKQGHLSGGDIAGAAAGVFASVMGTAVASAPLKAAQGLGDMLGLGGPKKAVEEKPVIIAFQAGYTALDSVDLSAIAKLKQRLATEKNLNLTIRHELGGGDIARAAERANPSPTDAQNMAYQLRQQNLVAMTLRSNLAGEAESELSWGSSAAASGTLERLRDVNRQIAQTDDAIDRVYELLRPGADRQAARRTRGACLDYGRDRLAAVQTALLANEPPDVKDRIHVTNPQYTDTPGTNGGRAVIALVVKKKG